MSKLDEYKKAKKEIAKDEETILDIGKEGKEGIKNAKEYFKKEEDREAEIVAIEKDILKKKKKDEDYIRQLAKMLTDRLFVIELPSSWSFRVEPTDKGVVMELYNNGKIYRTAFKATFVRDVDVNAVDTFALRAMNMADKQEKVSDGGIILE